MELIEAKQAYWYSWTGTSGSETEALLAYNDSIREGKVQVADLGTIVGTAESYSTELVLALKPDSLDTDLQAIDLRVLQVHGKLPSWLTLIAKAAATYTEPKDDGTKGVPADTDLLPGTPRNTVITMDWNGTNSEFAYLHLQAKKAAGANTVDWDPMLLEGESGIFHINAEMCVQLADLSGNPAGNADDFIFHANKVDLFVEENDILQRLGCYEKEFTVEPTIDTAYMDKAGVRISAKRTSSSLAITGQFSGLTPYNQALLMGGTIDNTDPNFMKVKFGDLDEPIRFKKVWLRARSNYGRVVWYYLPEAFVMYDGSWTKGGDEGTKYGLRVEALRSHQIWNSKKMWQFFPLAIKVATSAT